MNSVAALVADELAGPVDPRVADIAAAIAALHPTAACAVLFYGSCLRETRFDGLMLDFYLIVNDYRSAYRSRWEAWANRVLPPNVYPCAHAGLVAKYAVLSQADLARFCRGEGPHAMPVMARFAQPARIAWAADAHARRTIAASVAEATPALLRHGGTGPAEERWRRVFSGTYQSELRAERRDRAASLVAADHDRYRRLASMVPSEDLHPAAEARYWHRARWQGKVLTLLRLAKASATFAGGLDYLAWKINRHAGTRIAISPWQRRIPLLGALILLPKLILRGAVR